MAERPTLFIDRSLGKGVGRRLQENGAKVELHDDHFPQTTRDSEWIPEVTARGWVILTKDKNIRRAGGERADVILARAKVFTLQSGNMNGARMAELFLQNLAEIERIANEVPSPFAYVVGSAGCQPIFVGSTPDSPEPNVSDASDSTE